MATDRLRQLLAQEAARFICESGSRDFSLAKRHALARLHLPTSQPLPSNREIEAAIASYHALFHGAEHRLFLQQARREAIRAMELFSPFRPRLVGALLSGTADSHSAINLHLFAATPEELDLFLIEHGIPFEHAEQRLRFSSGEYLSLPLYRFYAGEQPFELTLFESRLHHRTPLSPVDGRPMARADIKQLCQLSNAPL